MYADRVRRLVVFAVLALVAAACGGGTDGAGGESGGSSEAQADGEPVTIQLALEASGDTPLAYEEQITRFNESQDGITVELRTFTGGDAYNQAILGQAAGGRPPDVFLVDGGQRIQTFAGSGTIRPLEELAASADVDLANFQESLLDAFRVNDQLYAIPKDFNTTALFFHEDMLQEAGIEPPESWQELREAANQLTSGDTHGLGMYPEINYFLAFIKAAGGNFVTSEGIENFENPEHLAAVDFLTTLFREDGSAVSPQMMGASWDGEMLANKQVAMVYGGTWISGTITGPDTDLQLGAVPLPPDAEQGAVLYTAGWVVAEASEHPEAAMELIAFLTSDEELVAGREAALIGLPPTESGSQAVSEEAGDDPALSIAPDLIEHSVPFGWMEPQFVDQYNQMLSSLVSGGNRSPEQAVTEMAQQIE